MLNKQPLECKGLTVETLSAPRVIFLELLEKWKYSSQS